MPLFCPFFLNGAPFKKIGSYAEGDGSLDAFFVGLLERTKVFLTPHMTDYLWELVRLGGEVKSK